MKNVKLETIEFLYLSSNLRWWSKEWFSLQGGEEVDHLAVIQAVALPPVRQVILNVILVKINVVLVGGQFHQHFKSSFFTQKCYAQLFCTNS